MGVQGRDVTYKRTFSKLVAKPELKASLLPPNLTLLPWDNCILPPLAKALHGGFGEDLFKE